MSGIAIQAEALAQLVLQHWSAPIQELVVGSEEGILRTWLLFIEWID